MPWKGKTQAINRETNVARKNTWGELINEQSMKQGMTGLVSSLLLFPDQLPFNCQFLVQTSNKKWRSTV
jgi:hypothetical protein